MNFLHSVDYSRYDGRGHLFSLAPYDADFNKNYGVLSAEEQRIERLCEEERYLELHTDIAEKALQEGKDRPCCTCASISPLFSHVTYC